MRKLFTQTNQNDDEIEKDVVEYEGRKYYPVWVIAQDTGYSDSHIRLLGRTGVYPAIKVGPRKWYFDRERIREELVREHVGIPREAKYANIDDL